MLRERRHSLSDTLIALIEETIDREIDERTAQEARLQG